VALVRILGIDPGSRTTGYALATFRGQTVVGVELGHWGTGRPERARERALAELRNLAEQWVAERSPDLAAVESLFHHRNTRSVLVLAEARGVLLSVLGKLGVPVVEFPPATIKRTICGSGSAGKERVRDALLRTVPGVVAARLGAARLDATDALAAAVCAQSHLGWRRAVVPEDQS
jgi:crossover junction endodeoxyribonuclease RuvC